MKTLISIVLLAFVGLLIFVVASYFSPEIRISESEVNENILRGVEIPDNDVLTKVEFLGIVAAMVDKCGDSCGCGGASSCRSDVLDEKILILQELKGWKVSMQTGVSLWFLTNVVRNKELIKANNREMYFPKYYDLFTAEFVDE